MTPLSPHQACYFAHELTRLGAVGELDRLSNTLFDSKVDLNPHQIDAALFALSNPLQKGVILADEVGLGKTIEAGLVLCQKWAERRRKPIFVVPAHIRKQWQAELMEKFSHIAEATKVRDASFPLGFSRLGGTDDALAPGRACENAQSLAFQFLGILQEQSKRSF